MAESLRAEARRHLVRTSVSMDDWQTRSGAAILRDLKAAGLGIRKTDFLAIRREVLGLTRYEEQIRRLKPGSTVPKAWMSKNPGWKMSGKYLYQAEISGTDPETGKDVKQKVAVASNRRLTVQSISDSVQSWLVGADRSFWISSATVSLFHAYIA